MPLSPLDVSRFTTEQVAFAANIPAGTLHAQFRRGEIALGEGEIAELRQPGTGRTRYFSARRALHIALTQELARCGLTIGQASRAALAFTDHNGADDAPAVIVGDGTPVVERQPGELFARGGTVMRVAVPRGAEPVVSVERLPTVQASPFTIPPGRTVATVLLINLDDLTARTFARLGFEQ